MKTRLLPLLLATLWLCGCGGAAAPVRDDYQAPTTGSNANAFNPYTNETLPNTRQLPQESRDILESLGARPQSIESEAQFRPNWREELYPVVFGDKEAPHELIVLLDFSNPESQKVWEQVVAASKSLDPRSCKIVVFGRSRENYGTDLMGLAIWISHSRPGQAMGFLSYALARWNDVKAAQRKRGAEQDFNNEYDSAANVHDFPIHYTYLSRLNPPVPASQELEVSRYSYNAGNVNMYQATQVARYYGVSSFPAVIADGRLISPVTSQAIVQALK